MKKPNKKQRDHQFLGDELERQKQRILERYKLMDEQYAKSKSNRESEAK